MGQVKVLYHADLDGRCAGAVVKHKHPEAHCFEVNYDQPLPLDQIQPDDTVYMVDFSPATEADFRRLVEASGKVIWIDHHWKNIQNYKFYDQCLDGVRVDTKPSGAMLTWQYLFPESKHIPPAVIYTSDYDTWTFDYGMFSKAFHAGISSYPHGPDVPIWNTLIRPCDPFTEEQTASNIIQRGQIILEHKKYFYADVIKVSAFECEFEGYQTIACNCPLADSSLFDSVDITKYDVLMRYHNNGENIVVSLYCDHTDTDCAELASRYGGGGHKGAAGFACKILPVDNVRKITNEELA